MKLSVVVPTHDKAALLRRTLDSLEAQAFDPADFEVIVVDDGSTDATRALLESRHPAHGLAVVRLESNRGRAAARNRGLERAGGDVVVFLDDDMELAPELLAAHRRLHEEDGRVAGVGNVVNHPEVSVAPIDRYMSTRGAQKIRNRGPLPWKYFSTNNSSVKREDLEAIGGFDEAFVRYGFEDLELALRLVRDRGVVIRFVEEARSFHIHPHTLREVLEKKTLCGRSSLPYLFEKHPESRRELGFHRFDPPRRGDPPGLNLRRIVYRTLLRLPLAPAAGAAARVDLGRLTDLAIDYLVLTRYLKGLEEYRP